MCGSRIAPIVDYVYWNKLAAAAHALIKYSGSGSSVIIKPPRNYTYVCMIMIIICILDRDRDFLKIYIILTLYKNINNYKYISWSISFFFIEYTCTIAIARRICTVRRRNTTWIYITQLIFDKKTIEIHEQQDNIRKWTKTKKNRAQTNIFNNLLLSGFCHRRRKRTPDSRG